MKDGHLRLYAGSKKEYMGFWSPSNEPMALYVRYSFGDKMYEIEVEDQEPLYLPAFRASVIGDRSVVH